MSLHVDMLSIVTFSSVSVVGTGAGAVAGGTTVLDLFPPIVYLFLPMGVSLPIWLPLRELGSECSWELPQSNFRVIRACGLLGATLGVPGRVSRCDS